jgi:hypothetical protein
MADTLADATGARLGNVQAPRNRAERRALRYRRKITRKVVPMPPYRHPAYPAGGGG